MPQAITISSSTINHTIQKAIVHFFNSASSLIVIQFLSQIYICNITQCGNAAVAKARVFFCTDLAI